MKRAKRAPGAGRPAKPAGQHRLHRLTLRLDDEERQLCAQVLTILNDKVAAKVCRQLLVGEFRRVIRNAALNL